MTSGFASDTTRLQPVVLQLQSYSRRPGLLQTPPSFSRWYFNRKATHDVRVCFRHHQASAGGTSTSKLLTTSGFASDTTRLQPVVSYLWERWSLAVKWKYLRLKPGGVAFLKGWCLAVKLKYHRLKPGGVAFLKGWCLF